MLSVNPNRAVEIQIKDAYCREVARRIGANFWSFPTRNSAMVPAAANSVIRLKAKVEDYVRSHFVAMNRDFCLQVFKLAYPPFGCMVGPRATARYEKYMLTVDSFKKVNKDGSIMEQVYAQARVFNNSAANKTLTGLRLLVISKAISIHTLAYLRASKFVSKETTSKVLDFLYEEKSEGDIYERYDLAEKEVRGLLGFKDEG
jgi:hypothetical protein